MQLIEGLDTWGGLGKPKSRPFEAQDKQGCRRYQAMGGCGGSEIIEWGRTAPEGRPYNYCLGFATGLTGVVELVPPTMVADLIVSSLGYLVTMYFSPPFSMLGCSPAWAGSGYWS
jgi:hypothetical protein